jgi:hypothetical protein
MKKPLTLFLWAVLLSALGVALFYWLSRDEVGTTRIFRIIPSDGNCPDIVDANGKRLDITISDQSSPVSKKTLLALKYEVYIGTVSKGNTESPIYVVGSLGKKIPGKAPSSGGEGRQESREFNLKGWFIKTPYIAYPQALPTQEAIPPVTRATLRAEDFTQIIDPRVIHADQKDQIYWIEFNPSELKP